MNERMINKQTKIRIKKARRKKGRKRRKVDNKEIGKLKKQKQKKIANKEKYAAMKRYFGCKIIQL